MKETFEIIDLHCDTLTELWKRDIGLQNGELHFSLHKLSPPYRLCQVFAIFMPDSHRGEAAELYFEKVCQVFEEQMRRHRKEICRVIDTAGIDDTLSQYPFAAILAVEGGSVLAGKLERLDMLKNIGVKLITLTWNGANEICGGAMTDIGFTAFGKQVVSRMEELGIAVDVSHLSDRGFWELCEFAGQPFLATHSNSRAVRDHRRNLTDGMFREIARRGGIVGLNYSKNFIAGEGGVPSVDDLLRHVYHFLELGGENALALGSDFDGTDMPQYFHDGLGSVVGLLEAMRRSGIAEPIVQKIAYKNARRYFARLRRGSE